MFSIPFSNLRPSRKLGRQSGPRLRFDIACGKTFRTRSEGSETQASEARKPADRTSTEADKEADKVMGGGTDVEMTENHENLALDTSAGNANGSESPDTEVEVEEMTESPISPRDVDANGSADYTKPASREGVQGGQGLRSTSSRVASLRAAFEQGDGPPEGVKRRLGSRDRGKEGSQEQEAEIARLKEELGKEKELRLAYEDKVTNLEEEVEELQSQLEEREEVLQEEYEQRSLQEKSEAQDRLSALASEARSQRQEATTLQKQLSDLKRSVSTSTRTSTHVGDTTFRQEIGVLQHEVQNWVVHNFRRAKVDASADELCSRLEKVTASHRIRPIYENFDQSVRLPIYQATAASLMMDIFDESYLFGIASEVEVVEPATEVADMLSTVLQPAAYGRWRAVTFDALRQSDSVKEAVKSAAQEVAETINITLTAVTENEDSEARLTSLKAIMKRAIDLAHLIRVQQAQYEFVLPLPGESFDSTSMDDISEAPDNDAERSIRCATFPSLVKISDENGEQLDPKSLIVKSMVLCHESEP